MELPFYPVIPLLGLYPKNPDTPIQKNSCTPVFIAVLFTIANIFKKLPKCPSVDEWIKKKRVTFIQWNTTQQEKKNFYTYNSMDGTGDYHAKWNKPVSERQIPYDLTCKWNLINKMN